VLYLLVAALLILCPTITFLFFILLPPTSSLNSVSGPTKHRHKVIIAHHGVVATDDRRCSTIECPIQCIKPAHSIHVDKGNTFATVSVR
jgi:hypothetical protein